LRITDISGGQSAEFLDKLAVRPLEIPLYCQRRFLGCHFFSFFFPN
jgi:hypothetical protein